MKSATDQTFGQQKGQRADLYYENEHLHRAPLFLLAVPRQGAPDCRRRSRKSDRSRRDTAGPANHNLGQRSSSSQLQLRPYQQIAAPTDEKEAEGKPKRVRIGSLKKQNTKRHPDQAANDEWQAALPAKTLPKLTHADQLCRKAGRIEDRHCRYGDEPKQHDRAGNGG